jgi:hypothetical protein
VSNERQLGEQAEKRAFEKKKVDLVLYDLKAFFFFNSNHKNN